MFPLPFETLAAQRPNTPVLAGTMDDEYAWNLVIVPTLAPGAPPGLVVWGMRA